jgi:RimJ/RimL family protein N-acetyltransferase
MRVLEKCGYEREGRQRRAVFKDGRFADVVVYARLRPRS